jgi:hypothetical protein
MEDPTLAAEIAELWSLVGEGPVHPDLKTRDDFMDVIRFAVYAVTD